MKELVGLWRCHGEGVAVNTEGCVAEHATSGNVQIGPHVAVM